MANLGTAWVILAAFCWGLSGGIAGLLLAEGWDALLIAFYRGAVGLVLVAIWLLLSLRVKRSGGRGFSDSGLKNPRLWYWSALAGLGVAGNFSFYFLSIAEGSVAVAATLMYCAPVFVYLVSFILGLERPTVFKWLAIALVLVGVVLLTRVYAISSADVSLLAVATGLLSGLCYALFIFGFKYAVPQGSPQAILLVAFAVLVTGLFALLLVQGSAGQTLAVLHSSDWPLFLLLGLLGAGLSFILYIYGLHQTAPAVAAMVAMVEPVTAALFGVLVLDERLLGMQIVGMVLILLTVTALSIRSKAQRAFVLAVSLLRRKTGRS